MKSIFGLVITVAATISLAKPQKTSAVQATKQKRTVAQIQTQSPEGAVFLRYLECGRFLASADDVSKLPACVNAQVVSAPARQRALQNWLSLRIPVREVRDCTAAEVRLVQAFPGKTEHVVCFTFHDPAGDKVGFAFQQWVDGKLLILSLHAIEAGRE